MVIIDLFACSGTHNIENSTTPTHLLREWGGTRLEKKAKLKEGTL
jgi:hypothetical protein